MRNSAEVWEKTARIGDLCWCKISNLDKYHVGIVLDIINFDYWNPTKKPNWIYSVWSNGRFYLLNGNKVDKI